MLGIILIKISDEKTFKELYFWKIGDFNEPKNISN